MGLIVSFSVEKGTYYLSIIRKRPKAKLEANLLTKLSNKYMMTLEIMYCLLKLAAFSGYSLVGTIVGPELVGFVFMAYAKGWAFKQPITC